MTFAKLKYLVALLVLIYPSVSFADIVLTPPGLAPGSQYRLAFVTSGTQDATSSNIADYNTFVTNQAALNPMLASITQWRAIGSTATIDARDNTGTNPSAIGVPVYRLDGIKIADNNSDIWDGGLDVSISRSQFDTPISGTVWVGSTLIGTAPASSFALGGSTPFFGSAAAADPNWAAFSQANAFNLRSFYAISGIQTVAVPEPSSTLLVGIATCVWSFARRRRKTNS